MSAVAVESLPGKEPGRIAAQQRRLVCVVVVILGLLGAFYFQKGRLSLHSAPAFAVGLLVLLAVGEITVRILDRMKQKEGHRDSTATADGPIPEVLKKLSWGGVVLHNIYAGHERIGNLVFRPEGVVFLIETRLDAGSLEQTEGELKLNGKPLPEGLVKDVQRKRNWLCTFLRRQLGSEPRLEAAILFPNANVSASYTADGVALLGLEHLEPWLDTAHPDDAFGRKLWQQMGQLRTELLGLSETASLAAMATPAGVVLALGVVWLTVTGPVAAKQPAVSVPSTEPRELTQEPADQVASVVTHPEPGPAPGWVKDIHLEGVAGAAPHQLAIFNGKTVSVGESTTIKVARRTVMIRCVAIQGESASINVEGVVGTIELSLGDKPRETTVNRARK